MKNEVYLLMFILCVSFANAGLMESPWPMFRGNTQLTGLSSYDTSHVDGTLLWQFKAGAGIESSPAIDKNGVIYFGSHDGYLYSIKSDGKLNWKTKLGTPREKQKYGHLISIGSSPAIASDGTIYVASQDQYLHAVSSAGKEKWKFPIGHSFDAWASPAIGDDGTIYITSSKPKAGLYALNSDGTEKWFYPAGTNMFNSPSIGKDGTIIVGMPSGPKTNNIIAIDNNGKKKWSTTTDLFLESSPTIAKDGTIYIGSFVNGDSGAGLYSISSTGKQNWYFKTKTKEVMATPAIGKDGTIYVGDYLDSGSWFHAINPDGTEKWSFAVSGSISSSAAIGADGTIYFGVSSVQKGKSFIALNSDGTIKWSYDKRGSFAASPAIGKDGTVYAADWGGNLYAFGSKKQVEVKDTEQVNTTVPENKTTKDIGKDEWHPKDHGVECFTPGSIEIEKKCDKFCSDWPDYCPSYFEMKKKKINEKKHMGDKIPGKDYMKDSNYKKVDGKDYIGEKKEIVKKVEIKNISENKKEENKSESKKVEKKLEVKKNAFIRFFGWFRGFF